MTDTDPKLPKGFTQADTDVDDYPSWDFDKDGILQGSILKIKNTEILSRGEFRDVRLAVINTVDGELCLLWESANLKLFFDKVKVGSLIWVKPAGEKDFGDGRTMRLYSAYFK